MSFCDPLILTTRLCRNYNGLSPFLSLPQAVRNVCIPHKPTTPCRIDPQRYLTDVLIKLANQWSNTADHGAAGQRPSYLAIRTSRAVRSPQAIDNARFPQCLEFSTARGKFHRR